jgi:hypothetical protein
MQLGRAPTAERVAITDSDFLSVGFSLDTTPPVEYGRNDHAHPGLAYGERSGAADVAAVWLRLRLFPWALTDLEDARTLLPC